MKDGRLYIGVLSDSQNFPQGVSAATFRRAVKDGIAEIIPQFLDLTAGVTLVFRPFPHSEVAVAISEVALMNGWDRLGAIGAFEHAPGMLIPGIGLTVSSMDAYIAGVYENLGYSSDALLWVGAHPWAIRPDASPYIRSGLDRAYVRRRNEGVRRLDVWKRV